MTRRSRTQAVPAGEEPRRRKPASGRRPTPAGPGDGGASGLGCVGFSILGAGLLLVIIGLAVVVTQTPSAPTPTPPSGPLPIAFGYALDPDTHLVTEPGSQFHHGDPFCYSVDPPTPPGVGKVYVSIVQLQGGVETVLQPPTAQALRPDATTFGFEVTADEVISLFGYGRFTMKIYLDPDGEVYAQGRFELVDPGIPR